MPDPTGFLLAFLALFVGLASIFVPDMSEDEQDIEPETDEIETEFDPVSM